MIYRDAGTYACHAGLSIAELRLKIKPKPGDREPTAQDYEESTEEIDENESKRRSFFFAFDVNSIHFNLFSVFLSQSRLTFRQ